ncbi:MULTISPECIES: spore gernimation protein [Brevibacillus]|uniref:spore gernimation protein n=1 Tax=Brevibacillus TaxID=55080 RepID=UPI001C8E31C1|nr:MULTISPECIES: spore gernimation protein [Brevibacillus]MBY0088634.1 spore gernimation protein [Brevibacillus brevis]MCM3143281.1 spore gernimation protein [Brevibacillus sp. MER 51]
MMRYQVINEVICVKRVSIEALSSAASLFIGDTQTVSLRSIYETPPEKMIVGATIPVDTAIPAS